MKAEIRADGLHIVGYVNVPGRESRPVITPRGKVVEVIEQRAFQRAIEKADSIDLMLDHERVIGSTSDGTLTAYEDEVGLRAEAVINDEEVIKGAKEGKLKGWSFNMFKVKDEVEQRADKLPLRHVREFDMSEITLVMNKQPVYSSMSIEVRADNNEEEVEVRSERSEITVTDRTERTETYVGTDGVKRTTETVVDRTEKTVIDYSAYEETINALKGGY